MIPDIRYIHFKEEYLPIGMEFSVQKENLEQPFIIRFLDLDGEHYPVNIYWQFSKNEKEVIKRLFNLESIEHYPNVDMNLSKNEEFLENVFTFKAPYGLPRDARSLKRSDPELFAFSRQFLKDDTDL